MGILEEPPWLNSCRPYCFSHWQVLVHPIQCGISTILSLVDWSVICDLSDAIRNAEMSKALEMVHPWAIKGQSSATNQFSIFPHHYNKNKGSNLYMFVVEKGSRKLFFLSQRAKPEGLFTSHALPSSVSALSTGTLTESKSRQMSIHRP